VDIHIQVGEDCWCDVGQVVENLDNAALFSDKDPSVGGELKDSGLFQINEDFHLSETR
jgi:hypothetical protein